MSFITRGNASLLDAGATQQSTSNAQPPPFFRRPFASLGAGLFAAGAPPQPVTEKSTGQVFPGEFCYMRKHDCPRVTGIGSRTKRVLGVKTIDVYVLALYVDPHAAKSTLGHKFRGAAVGELAKNQRLFDELVEADNVEKTLRLVITSGLVNRGNFLQALEERLAPPLKKAGDATSLDKFAHLFDGVKFRPGLPLSFTSTKKGLVTQIDGKEVGVVPSQQFVHAFFDMYVGQNPVSAGAKESFAQGLASMVLS